MMQQQFTYNDDMAEPVAAADSRAIPPVVLELLLTLAEPKLGTVLDGHHDVRLLAANHALFGRQSGYLAAYEVSAQCHYRPMWGLK